MAWLRIDDGFATHPKIAQLKDRELRVWLRLMCYCAKTRDPTVDHVALQEVNGLTAKTRDRFVQLDLLDQVNGHLEIHDWEHYLPKDATNAERQARWRSRRNGKETP